MFSHHRPIPIGNNNIATSNIGPYNCSLFEVVLVERTQAVAGGNLVEVVDPVGSNLVVEVEDLVGSIVDSLSSLSSCVCLI